MQILLHKDKQLVFLYEMKCNTLQKKNTVGDGVGRGTFTPKQERKQ